MNELRFALRRLARRPVMAGAAVACLAIGIGAVTAVASLVEPVVWPKPPFHKPEGLVWVWGEMRQRGLERMLASGAELLDYRRRAGCFEAVAAFTPQLFNLTGEGEPERLAAARASAELWPLLGVKAAQGRVFTAQEDQPGHNRLALLSHRLWQRRFGGDPGVVGREIRLNDSSYQVVGVLPPEFELGPREIELWVPMALDPTRLPPRDFRGLSVLARLAPGTSLAAARARMKALAGELEAEDPRAYPRDSGWGLALEPFAERDAARLRPALAALALAVALVLAVAAANVAQLLLAWATGREREGAVRAALGASGGALARPFLLEGLVLAALGGLLGWGAAALLLRALPAVALELLPGWQRPRLDPLLFVASLGVSGLAGVAVSLAPAARARRPDLARAFKEGSAAAGQGRKVRRSRALLLASEVALALLVLAVATLLGRGLGRLEDLSPGFDAERLLGFEAFYSPGRVAGPAALAERTESLLAAVATAGPVESAAAATSVPFGRVQPLPVDVGAEAAEAGAVSAELRAVTPGFFATLGLPLAAGRAFAATDSREAPRVAVVDELLARRLWAGQSPLGRRVRLQGQGLDPAPRIVVGVVRGLASHALGEVPRPQLYLPFAQEPRGFVSVLVRTRGAPGAAAAAVAAALHRADPAQPVSHLGPLAENLAQSLAPRRALVRALGLFALVAALLAALGVYGLTAYSMGERRRELGLRLALGADRSRLLAEVLSRSLAPVLAGLGVGLLLAGGASLAAGRRLASLAATRPGDLATLVLAALALLVLALAASWAPARKATATSPATTLTRLE